MKKRFLAWIMGVPCLAWAAAPQTCNLPREVTFLVHAAAPGESYTIAQTLKPLLEKDLGITLTLQEVLGEGGLKALAQLANAAPDGSVIGTLPVEYALALNAP